MLRQEFDLLCVTSCQNASFKNWTTVEESNGDGFLSSFFHPRLEWTSQLSPLLGVGEVDKLNVKLRSLNVSGLHNFGPKISFSAPNLSGANYLQVKFSLLPSRAMVVFMSCGLQV